MAGYYLYFNLIKSDCPVYLQWIPSHVGVYGNEMADLLAREGSELLTVPSTKLNAYEVHSLFEAKVNFDWKIYLSHT